MQKIAALYVATNGVYFGLDGVDPWDVHLDARLGPSQGTRLDEGFHSRAERSAARSAGQRPIKRLSARQRISTPIPFRDLLISLARGVAC